MIEAYYNMYAKTYKSYKECLILCKKYLIQEKREKNTAAITVTKSITADNQKL